jgi:hypothetical protein
VKEIKELLTSISGTLKDVSESVKNFSTEMAQSFKQIGKADTSNIESEASEAKGILTEISNTLKDISNTVKSSFADAVQAFYQAKEAEEELDSATQETQAQLQNFDDITVEIDGVETTIGEMDKLGDAAEEAGEKIEEVPELQYGEPVDYGAIQEEQQAAEDFVNSYAQIAEETEQSMEGLSGEARKTAQEIGRLRLELLMLEEAQRRLSSAGIGTGNAEYDSNASRIAEIRRQLEGYNRDLDENSDKSNMVSSAQSKLKNAFSKVANAVKKGASAILSMNRANKKSNSSFGKSLKTILKYSLGIRSLFVLVNKLRSALVSGFSNLAQYSNETNQSISSLKTALTQLKNSFATAFAPLLNTVAPILTTFINQVSKAVTAVGMLIAALTGQTTYTKAVAAQEDYAASLADTSSNADDAKKSLKGYLSGLDEVQKFETDDDSTSTSSGYTAPSASDMFETVNIDSSIKGIADKIKELVQGEDWEGFGAYIASGINTGLQKVYDAINWNTVGPKITYFVNAFTTTFNSLVKNIDWNLLGKTIGAGINTIVNTLNLLIEGIDWIALGSSFATGLNGLVKEVNWKNLGNLIGNKFMISWKVFHGFVENLKFEDIGLAISNVINGAIEKIDLGLMAKALSDFAIGLLQAMATAIKNTNWTAVGQQIADALRNIDWVGIASGLFDVGYELIKGLLEAFGELPGPVQLAAAAIGGFWLAFEGYTIISTVVGAIGEIVSFITGAGGLLEAIGLVVEILGGPVTIAIGAAIAAGVLIIANWDSVKKAAKTFVKGVKADFAELKKSLVDAWNGIKDAMKSFSKWLSGVFSHDWSYEFGIFGDVINGFLSAVGDVWEDIKGECEGIIEFITGVFSGNWKKAWQGIKKIFSSVFSGLADIAKAPINAIIGGFNAVISVINAVISKINSISFHISVPSWIPVIGGSSWGFNGFNISQVGKIPYLATGAVIPPNAPFMAVLGDQKSGTNIETPEDLLRQIIREELGNQNNSNSGGEYRFTAQINRRTLFDEVIEEAKVRRTNSGNNPFVTI